MTAYAPQSSEPAIAQINITPLVDVMLVLLVIFMVAAPALTAPMSLDLPSATTSQAEPPPRTLLRITQAGEFELEGATLSAQSLQSALARIAVRRDGTVLEIAVSDDADYQGFATALSAARNSGLRHVTLQP